TECRFQDTRCPFFYFPSSSFSRPSSPELPRGPEESSLKGELPPDPLGVQALACQAAENSRKISPKSHLKAELPPGPLGVQALAAPLLDAPPNAPNIAA